MCYFVDFYLCILILLVSAVARNAFTGSIPNEMSLLSDLDSLFFYDNRFTGTIPSKLSELSKLESINLRSNRLTGMIPDLSRSTMLYEFTVNQNELTSTIPSSFSVLPNLGKSILIRTVNILVDIAVDGYYESIDLILIHALLLYRNIFFV